MFKTVLAFSDGTNLDHREMLHTRIIMTYKKTKTDVTVCHCHLPSVLLPLSASMYHRGNCKGNCEGKGSATPTPTLNQH